MQQTSTNTQDTSFIPNTPGSPELLYIDQDTPSPPGAPELLSMDQDTPFPPDSPELMDQDTPALITA